MAKYWTDFEPTDRPPCEICGWPAKHSIQDTSEDLCAPLSERKPPGPARYYCQAHLGVGQDRVAIPLPIDGPRR